MDRYSVRQLSDCRLAPCCSEEALRKGGKETIGTGKKKKNSKVKKCKRQREQMRVRIISMCQIGAWIQRQGATSCLEARGNYDIETRRAGPNNGESSDGAGRETTGTRRTRANPVGLSRTGWWTAGREEKKRDKKVNERKKKVSTCVVHREKVTPTLKQDEIDGPC
jgi:hypothetical protein